MTGFAEFAPGIGRKRGGSRSLPNPWKLMSLYVRMTKPTVWGALVVTAILGFMIGAIQLSSFGFGQFVLATGALLLGTSGCESITNFIDLPIDRVMHRTMNRPLPAGELTPRTALFFGAASIALALVLSWALGYLLLLLMTFGIIDNVLIYSYWLKRRSTQNVIWGGFSGAIPVMYGFYAANPGSLLIGILLFSLVFLWTPPHIWSISVECSDDYNRAGVPMLPVVSSEKIWKIAMTIFTAGMIIIDILISIILEISDIQVIIAVGLNIIVARFLYNFLKRPKERSHGFFVFLNIYLVLALAVLL